MIRKFRMPDELYECSEHIVDDEPDAVDVWGEICNNDHPDDPTYYMRVYQPRIVVDNGWPSIAGQVKVQKPRYQAVITDFQ